MLGEIGKQRIEKWALKKQAHTAPTSDMRYFVSYAPYWWSDHPNDPNTKFKTTKEIQLKQKMKVYYHLCDEIRQTSIIPTFVPSNSDALQRTVRQQPAANSASTSRNWISSSESQKKLRSNTNRQQPTDTLPAKSLIEKRKRDRDGQGKEEEEAKPRKSRRTDRKL
ncbi:hypothetical protein [Parasitella parasitica]|uniref:Uncharacterized protein n=1 Tax=Parasitella parasitica TaxID=35722 RepID=A0A0B7NH64_9FUNG|nr:hypothetical protein [Parasitella parasitica]